jgi:DNA-binding MarR family transcriptional regulator
LDDERLITILCDLGRRILGQEHKIRKKLGLSEAEYKGILCLNEAEKITCQEFSKRMNLSVSRGSRVVDLLCLKKYIQRVGCKSDRRCKNIWLTEKGNEVRLMIAGEILAVENALTEGYHEAKIMLLKSDLKRLCSRI